MLEREAQHERARPHSNLEYQLGNIGSIADCFAALTIERTDRDQEPLVKVGYMLRLHQKAAYDAFEALPPLGEGGPVGDGGACRR